MLRFITCGSVDDGKSTLIGRLLFESNQILDDQMSSLKADSKKFGTQGEKVDYALLVDGLSAEREQGITIDVAYRFFATKNRKFMVADTPGHEQYTRNMVTGASTSQLAVLLIDARKGILLQTKRHASILSLMGIQHVILAINKMDLVNYDKQTYENIKNDFEALAKNFRFQSQVAIPVSALEGDNLFNQSNRMRWYQGFSLIEHLENIEIQYNSNKKLIFPIQYVNRPNSEFRGFSGTIASGTVKVGDEVCVSHSRQIARVSNIVTIDGNLKEASSPQAVTITLDKEIDISRGSVLSLLQKTIETTNFFNATVVWMHEDKGLTGRSYDLKLGSQWTTASISEIKYRINMQNLTHEPIKDMSLNDICVCNIRTTKEIAFEVYKNPRSLGGFILVDKLTNATVAAGMIHFSLRRSQNIHTHQTSINKSDREALNGHKGKVIWFTGLSGAGKSTVANLLDVKLHAQGKHTYILDGDNIRDRLNRDLGFTESDRAENIRRIIEVARLMCDAGLIVLVAFISPFERERKMAREVIGKENFLEVYINTPLEVCEKRDVKGLYSKARAGLIPNMTGINSPYEIPVSPEITIDTSKNTNLEHDFERIFSILKS